MKDLESTTCLGSNKSDVGVSNVSSKLATPSKELYQAELVMIQTVEEVATFCKKSTSWVYDHWEDLKSKVQEVIIDLIVSIIENKKTKK